MDRRSKSKEPKASAFGNLEGFCLCDVILIEKGRMHFCILPFVFGMCSSRHFAPVFVSMLNPNVQLPEQIKTLSVIGDREYGNHPPESLPHPHTEGIYPYRIVPSQENEGQEQKINFGTDGRQQSGN